MPLDRRVLAIAATVLVALAAGEVVITHADPSLVSSRTTLVSLRGENTGASPATNVSVSLSARGIRLGPYRALVGPLGPSEAFSVAVTLGPLDGSGSPPSLAATVSWLEDDGAEGRSPTILVPLRVRGEGSGLEVASVYPATVTSGMITTVVIQLLNPSGEAVDGLVVAAAPSPLYRLLDGSTRTVGRIGPGERRAVTFSIYLSPDALGFVELPLRAEHGGGTVELEAGLVAVPLLRVEVANLAAPREALPGARTTLSFDVLNLGDQAVRSARIESRATGAAVSKDTVFLGVLAPQEGRRVSLEVVPPASSAGSNISVETVLRFRDAVGVEHERTMGHVIAVATGGPQPSAAQEAGGDQAPEAAVPAAPIGPTEALVGLGALGLAVVAWLGLGYRRRLRAFEQELLAERDQLDLLEEQEEREMGQLRHKVEQIETAEHLDTELQRVPVGRLSEDPRRFADRLVAVGDHVRRLGEKGRHSLVEVSDATGTVKGVRDGPVRDGPGTAIALVRFKDGVVHLEIKTVLRER